MPGEAKDAGERPGEAPRAKPLPRRPPSSAPPDLVPARMVNEVLYCERLMALEWVQGEFADNYFTVDGRAAHKRADKKGRGLPEPERDEEESDDAAVEDGGEEPYQARSVWLSSEGLGLTAKIDVVDVGRDGRVMPVEYKRGKRPNLAEGAYLPERAQLCAQVLLLRDAGYRCDDAAIYYARERRRVPIAIDAQLESTTRRAIERAREIAGQSELPPPLDDSPKCRGCSLVGICLPDEVTLLKTLERGAPPAPEQEPAQAEPDWRSYAPDLYGPMEKDPWALAGDPPLEEPAELRRLHPARDDRLPVYVQEQGARIALDGERICIRKPKEKAVEARLVNTSQVSVFGNVQVTSQALRALLERGVPVSFFTYGGWLVGRATGHDSKNVELRLAQYAGATDPATCLRLARGFVVSKILNSRTLLRRNHRAVDGTVLFELKQLARKAGEVASLESLLGIEGSAARVYFGAFTGMLKDEPGIRDAFDLDGRNRRPPRDPINAMLSFCYALLAKDFHVTLAGVGLDPLLGFYHQPRFGRPALALDLMEEFRPIVADSVVVSAINNGEVQPDDFVRTAVAVSLKQPARRRLILAYERRMDHLVTHPVFGYRISYRRVLEVQARLLGRMLLGEVEQYPSFRTR